jgi:peptidoglycan/LPS O-acetylase OafA/YrhL
MIVFAFLMKHHVLGATHIPIVLPLVVVIAVLFGLLAHYMVERPILSWLRGHLEPGQSQLKKLTAASGL